jgi:hypothetical protein
LDTHHKNQRGEKLVILSSTCGGTLMSLEPDGETAASDPDYPPREVVLVPANGPDVAELIACARALARVKDSYAGKLPKDAAERARYGDHWKMDWQADGEGGTLDISLSRLGADCPGTTNRLYAGLLDQARIVTNARLGESIISAQQGQYFSSGDAENMQEAASRWAWACRQGVLWCQERATRQPGLIYDPPFTESDMISPGTKEQAEELRPFMAGLWDRLLSRVISVDHRDGVATVQFIDAEGLAKGLPRRVSPSCSAKLLELAEGIE